MSSGHRFEVRDEPFWSGERGYIMTRYLKSAVRVAVCLLVGLTTSQWIAEAQSGRGAGWGPWGPNYQPNPNVETHRDHRRRPPIPQNAMAMVHHWNRVAVDAAGLDHTPPAPN